MKYQQIKLVDSIWKSVTYNSLTDGLELTTIEWTRPFFHSMGLPKRLQENQERWIYNYQLFKKDLENSTIHVSSPQVETQVLISYFEKILNHVADEISIGSSLALSNWFKRHFLIQEFQRSMSDWRLILQYTFFPCQRHLNIPPPPSELTSIFPLIEPLIWSDIERSRLELLKMPLKEVTLKQQYIEQELYGTSLDRLELQNDEFLHDYAWQIHNIMSRESTRKALIAIDRLIKPSERSLVFQWFNRYHGCLLDYHGSEIDSLEKAICIASRSRVY